ncbi:MAG: hypothetical protein GQ526_06455 [Ardenticatenales bacterium]|nr:hypothetical protein [Ardenticatenales bacterium]
MKQRIPTAVAIFFGWLTLLGYFLRPGYQVHHLFIGWAATLAAVALLLGVLNLLSVHLHRIANQDRDWPYSIALILSVLVVLAVALIERDGPGGAMVAWVFRSVLFPLQAAAASLLAFFLVSAAFRAMRKRPTLPTFIFVTAALLVLLGTIPATGGVMADVRGWLVRVFSMAGARGMLIGVALGTIATGVRMLAGMDRPHSEREP